MYCRKCGRQIEEACKECPYCGNSILNEGQEEGLKREEDKKYNRKMAVWLVVNCVTEVVIAVWLNSVWYQLYFWKLLDFVKNHIAAITLMVICHAILYHIAKDHVSLKFSSEKQEANWKLVAKMMSWISGICYAMITILFIKAIYEVVIMNGNGFRPHLILAKAQGVISWYAISYITNSVEMYVYGGNKDDETGVK